SDTSESTGSGARDYSASTGARTYSAASANPRSNLSAPSGLSSADVGKVAPPAHKSRPPTIPNWRPGNSIGFADLRDRQVLFEEGTTMNSQLGKTGIFVWIAALSLTLALAADRSVAETVNCTQTAIQSLAPPDTTIVSATEQSEPVPYCDVRGYVT